jgi:hypothetical protein
LLCVKKSFSCEFKKFFFKLKRSTELSLLFSIRKACRIRNKQFSNQPQCLPKFLTIHIEYLFLNLLWAILGMEEFTKVVAQSNKKARLNLITVRSLSKNQFTEESHKIDSRTCRDITILDKLRRIVFCSNNKDTHVWYFLQKNEGLMEKNSFSVDQYVMIYYLCLFLKTFNHFSLNFCFHAVFQSYFKTRHIFATSLLF